MTQVDQNDPPLSAPTSGPAYLHVPRPQSPARPPWLSFDAARNALANFERLGFPTTKLEQWRFTSVTPISEKGVPSAPTGLAGADAGLAASLSGGTAVAVCVNSRFAPTLFGARSDSRRAFRC